MIKNDWQLWLLHIPLSNKDQSNIPINHSSISRLWPPLNCRWQHDRLFNRASTEVCGMFLDLTPFDEGFYNQQWSSAGSDEQHAIIKPRSMWWDSQQIEANVSGRGSTWKAESSSRPQTEHSGVLLFVWRTHTCPDTTDSWAYFVEVLYRIRYKHWQKTNKSERMLIEK